MYGSADEVSGGTGTFDRRLCKFSWHSFVVHRVLPPAVASHAPAPLLWQPPLLFETGFRALSSLQLLSAQLSLPRHGDKCLFAVILFTRLRIASRFAANSDISFSTSANSWHFSSSMSRIIPGQSVVSITGDSLPWDKKNKTQGCSIVGWRWRRRWCRWCGTQRF